MRGRIKGVQMDCTGLSISHIFFADDTLIFLKAESQICRNLMTIIDAYCSASGQMVNKSKSSVFFGGNVPESLSCNYGSYSWYGESWGPWSVFGGSGLYGADRKRSSLAYIKGRLLGKLQGWKRSTLYTSRPRGANKGSGSSNSGLPYEPFQVP